MTQGSILGPLLFLIYGYDLKGQYLDSNLVVHAEDTAAALKNKDPQI